MFKNPDKSSFLALLKVSEDPLTLFDRVEVTGSNPVRVIMKNVDTARFLIIEKSRCFVFLGELQT
jgi:hypothetical protein